jgi:hypothetical protein
VKDLGNYLVWQGLLLDLYVFVLILFFGGNNFDGLIAPSISAIIGVGCMLVARFRQTRRLI